ncbi:MAG TPA: LptE family protein [Flavihumibacter sp.]|nr:LPS assembly lipoprotein LptE [Bacteroidota bacterium]HOA37393.1 LptE family protein [Flavihumibacter sp.]HPZ88628.1 LptE family protein [Flavihumibacter sp.]
MTRWLLLLLVVFCGGCYSFKDVSIPPDIKTVRINYIDNRARYVNPQLSPQLTDKLRQKVVSQTRLTQIQGDDADYEISATITDYSITTSGISANKTTASNRLNVTVAIMFHNRKDETKSYKDPQSITRNFDFDANLSIQQAEAQLGENIVRNLADEIFNRIFSNW